MNNLWQKLKNRWEVKSNLQAAIILSTFAITGFTTLYIHNIVNHLLGITTQTNFFIKAIIFLFVMTPIYNIILIIWGTIFGQKKFFKNFVLTQIKRIGQFVKNLKTNEQQE